MKTNKLIICILTLVLGISFNSCVEDGDYSVPQDLGLVENAEVEKIIAELNDPNGNLDAITIKNLKGLFIQDEATEITSDLVVKGYVTSSDRTGNFFKEIFIQDEAENPEAAIKVVLNLNDTYNKYNLGREIYIKLNGLFIGETRSGDGVITIGGVASGNEVDDVTIKQISENIFRSSVTKALVPKIVNLSEVSSDNLGMLVQIENAQFQKDIKDLTFGDPDEQFDTQRVLESCTARGSSISLETSSFSTFEFSPLPAGSFTINSVVSKTFDGSSLILVLNDKNDITVTGERCDPPELDCGLANAEGTSILFEDMFESQSTNSPISGNGWTNYQEAGTETWEAYRASGSNASQGISARVGAFRSGDDRTAAWLISPEIDLDANSNVKLSFETSNSFADASNLDVMFSNDWDGTIDGVLSATWGVLPAAYVVQDSDSFSSWFESGIVDLSCGSGKIHIAFKYTGSGDSANDGTYELDNFKITKD